MRICIVQSIRISYIEGKRILTFTGHNYEFSISISEFNEFNDNGNIRGNEGALISMMMRLSASQKDKTIFTKNLTVILITENNEPHRIYVEGTEK